MYVYLYVCTVYVYIYVYIFHDQLLLSCSFNTLHMFFFFLFFFTCHFVNGSVEDQVVILSLIKDLITDYIHKHRGLLWRQSGGGPIVTAAHH